MFKISSIYLNSEIQLTNYSSPRENSTKQKIYNLGRKIFNYLHRNQTAFAAVIWSYLFVEVGMVTSQMTFGEEYIDNIDSCQKILCQHWNTDIENRSQFSSVVQFQCNDPIAKDDLSTPYSFVLCMSYLCGYMNNIGKQIDACRDIFNQNTTQINSSISNENDTYSNELTLDIWKEICPVKHFRHTNILKEAAYMNECLTRLCNHYIISKINLDKVILDWCQNTNMNKLYQILTNLTNLVHESQRESTETGGWVKANIISTLTAALSGIVVGIISVVGTIVTCRAAKLTANVAQNVPSLSLGLRSMIHTATETTKALIEASGLEGNTIIPSNTLSALSEISDSLSYYSAQDSPMRDIELGIIEPELGAELGIDLAVNNVPKAPSVLLEALTVGGVSGGIIVSAILTKNNNKGIGAAVRADIGSTDTRLTSKGFVGTLIQEVIETSTESISSSTKQINVSNLKEIIQEYLNDYLLQPSEPLNLILRQVNRLKHSLQDWQNAFCYYEFPNNLVCRLPRPNQPSLVYLPINSLREMFSGNLNGLCYVFQEELWCNFNKFFDIVAGGRNMFTGEVNCPWDQIGLKIKEVMDGLYQLELSGGSSSCYNETAMIRV